MSNLQKFRERLNITQEELAELSGVSVRTIQRIEAGNIPKGYTLRILAKTLGIAENELVQQREINNEIPVATIKLINISSLPFVFLPPLNIIAPFLLMFYKNEKNIIAKEIVTIQLLCTIVTVFIFMLVVFIRKWFALNNNLNVIILCLLILSNVFIILRNQFEIDKNNKLYISLNFSII